MPKTVVVGGVWHKVYFNQNNAVNSVNIKAAIDLAMSETSVPVMSVPLPDITIQPNPMHHDGVMEVTNSQAEEIRMLIYDIGGRVVMQEITREYPAGVHRFDLPVADLPSGIFFLHVQVGQVLQVKKIVIAH